MKVLLNVTRQELAYVGGDQSYYRTLVSIAQHPDFGKNLDISLLEHSSIGWRNNVRFLERISGRLPRTILRQWLFTESRRVPISSRDIDVAQPDVVFSTILIARLPRGCQVANVFYSQGINAPEYYAYKGYHSVEDIAEYYRRASHHVSLMIIGTHDGKERLHALCPDLACETVYVPQVVLLDPVKELSHPSADEPVRMLFVGRDYVRKGLPEVLDAVRNLKGIFELHIVTKPDCPLETSDLNSLPIYWYSNLSNNELHELYSNSHVLVVPTHADTYNLVLIEAMAFGCAIVTSDLPPMGEIAPSGIVGVCVPIGDRVTLTDALQTMISNREQLAKMRTKALQHYSVKYAPGKVIPQLLSTFEKTLEKV